MSTISIMLASSLIFYSSWFLDLATTVFSVS